MAKLTQDDVFELRDSCNMEIGDAIGEYHRLTRKLRIEENPEDLLSVITTLLQKGSESGEVLGKVAKSIRDNRDQWAALTDESMGPIDRPIFDFIDHTIRDAVIKELGDDLFYISEMCNHLGITLFDLMIDNIEKLASRDQRGTLGGSGDDR